MKRKTAHKCLHCREFYVPDYRNRGRQRHCAKPACRKASKAHSQRQWLAREGNQNYFRSPDNSDRVKAWRREHPGYWRKKKPAGGIALQDPCSAQKTQREPVTTPCVPPALQEACLMQPAVLVGLISMMTGSALQEDIARSARSVLARGLDILGTVPGGPFSSAYEEQTHSASRAAPACAAAI